MKKYFDVCVKQYDFDKDFSVFRPASISNPKDNAVMFVKKQFVSCAENLRTTKNSLIFWPIDEPVPAFLSANNAVILSNKPHIDYCKFFKTHNIRNLPNNEQFQSVNGAFICTGAKIGKNSTIFPGAYIGPNVTVGENVYIGAGVKIIGEVIIGDNVIIRENTVIGADGLTTDRDENGKSLTMPQFGIVIIEDNVEIGANAIIARGAIDETIIRQGAKVDNSTFISHNVDIGRDTFIVGETIFFGSSSAGANCIISGNSTIMNRVHIGDNSIIGAGAVATKSIPENSVAVGCPAKVVREVKSGEEV